MNCHSPQHALIAIVVPDMDRIGGYEIQGMTLARAFKNAGLPAFILSDLHYLQKTYEIRSGVEVFRLAYDSQSIQPNLEKIFKKIGLKFINLRSLSFFSGEVIEVANRLNIPTIINIPTSGDIQQLKLDAKTKGPQYQRFAEQLKQCSLYCCLNQNIYDELLQLGISAEKLVTLPNMVDTQRFKRAEQSIRETIKLKYKVPLGKKIFLYIGRFEKRKKISWLVRAWLELGSKLNSAHLVLLGFGEEEEEIKSLLASHPQSRSVQIFNATNKVEEIYQLADIFVFPSIKEGMPNVVLEAMSSGLPVLGCDIDGVRELIQGEHNGWLIEPNSSEQLKQTLLQLSQANLELQRYSEATREWIMSRYSEQKVVEKHIELMQRFIESPLVLNESEQVSHAQIKQVNQRYLWGSLISSTIEDGNAFMVDLINNIVWAYGEFYFSQVQHLRHELDLKDDELAARANKISGIESTVGYQLGEKIKGKLPLNLRQGLKSYLKKSRLFK